MKFEIHFQEIFQGELITISVDGREKLQIEPRTRFQIGLAHIETLDLEEGSTLTLTIKPQGEQLHQRLSASTPFLAVTLHGNRLEAKPKNTSPKYA